MSPVHLYDQTLDDGNAPYSRTVMLIQNPGIPEPGKFGAGEGGIVEADFAVFESLNKSDLAPSLFLRGRFMLLRKEGRLAIRQLPVATSFLAFPPELPEGLREELREELWARFSAAAVESLQDVVRKSLPERAHLL